jgi:hypothetical protein
MNPFDQVFSALWTLAEASRPLKELVKVGNRIKFNQDDSRDPLKQQVADADLSELILTSEGITAINMHATSCSSMIARQYSWMITTGDYRISYRLNPLEWALYCAMTDWKSVLGSLKWNDYDFVKDMNFVSASEGLSDATRNRGIKGWSALWSCNVKMHFKTADLQLFNTGAL